MLDQGITEELEERRLVVAVGEDPVDEILGLRLQPEYPERLADEVICIPELIKNVWTSTGRDGFVSRLTADAPTPLLAGDSVVRVTHQWLITPAPPVVAETGRRRTRMPLIEIARAATEDEAMAGLERWKERHADVWPYLEEGDVLVDAGRGSSATWYRIRLNLRHVPPTSARPRRP